MEARSEKNSNNNNDKERQSKKRKAMEDEEEISEDQKVEQFFALLRSTREARDRLRSKDIIRRQDGKFKVNADGRRREKTNGVIWSPTFRPEDFLDDNEKNETTSSEPEIIKEEDRIGHVSGNNNISTTVNINVSNLDLNLSL